MRCDAQSKTTHNLRTTTTTTITPNAASSTTTTTTRSKGATAVVTTTTTLPPFSQCHRHSRRAQKQRSQLRFSQKQNTFRTNFSLSPTTRRQATSSHLLSSFHYLDTPLPRAHIIILHCIMYSRELQASKATLSTCASFIVATTILIACNAKQTTQDTQPKQQVSSSTGSLLSLGSFRQFPNNNRRQQINEQQAYNAQHKQQFNPNYQDLTPQEPIGIYTINQYQPTLVTDHTKNVYTQTMREVLIELQQTMQAKSENFDQYFKQLLALSRKDLDSTFNTTYGELYKHNTEVFIQMFNSLDNYYINGRVRISTIMESFFACLYQKIFQVLNPAFSFPASYLKCATDQLAPLKPFGDVPEKLTQEIKDSFIAARTFIQALRAGVDVVNNVKSVSSYSNS